MSTLSKEQERNIQTFLEENQISISDVEFEKSDNEFRRKLVDTHNLRELFDYFSETYNDSDIEIAKHQRTFIRIRILEVLEKVDPANPSDCFKSIFSEEWFPHFIVPTLRLKLQEIQRQSETD